MGTHTQFPKELPFKLGPKRYEVEYRCQSRDTPESQILSQKELGIKNQKEANLSGAEGSQWSIFLWPLH